MNLALFVPGIVITLCLAGCEKVAGQGVDRDDAAVFQAFLAWRCGGAAKRMSGGEVVSDRPYVVDVESDGHRGPGDDAIRILERLSKRDIGAHRWVQSKPCEHSQVADDDEVKRLIELEGAVPPNLQHFYAAYPGVRSLTHVSMPVYDAKAERAHAVLKSGAEVSGHAAIVEFERRDGVWVVAGSRTLWSSSF